MKQRSKRLLALLLVFLMVSGLAPAFAADQSFPDAILKDTASVVYHTVTTPQVGSIGGEWAILGLARSEYDVPDEYFQDYYDAVEEYAAACKGVLHEKKYTEYSRVVLALTALGKDAKNVAGYDILSPLGDYEKVVWQGINGPIWALIALDSGNYPMPQAAGAATQATRQMYVDHILGLQLKDGGWSLSGKGSADPDITGMALQVLASYQSQPAVKIAIEKALSCMSLQQTSTGGFSSWGTVNCESAVQMTVALSALGIPLTDARFVKNGHTMLNHLLTYYQAGKGFSHTKNSGSNLMVTEQALYALAAVQRMQDGRPGLYQMTDPLQIPDRTGEKSKGLPGKHADVLAPSITLPGKTFEDISSHANQPAIEALAARGILDGRTETAFVPNGTLTRAEFAALIVRALGLTPAACTQFSDVPAGRWYSGYIGAAYTYGIVDGTSPTTYEPEGRITRQEAAKMVASAAKLCGMEIDLDESETRDVLSLFEDYVTADTWARPFLAFCYQENILNQEDLLIRPKTAILRCETAQMVFLLLGSAKLL